MLYKIIQVNNVAFFRVSELQSFFDAASGRGHDPRVQLRWTRRHGLLPGAALLRLVPHPRLVQVLEERLLRAIREA